MVESTRFMWYLILGCISTGYIFHLLYYTYLLLSLLYNVGCAVDFSLLADYLVNGPMEPCVGSEDGYHVSLSTAGGSSEGGTIGRGQLQYILNPPVEPTPTSPPAQPTPLSPEALLKQDLIDRKAQVLADRIDIGDTSKRVTLRDCGIIFWGNRTIPVRCNPDYVHHDTLDQFRIAHLSILKDRPGKALVQKIMDLF